MYKIPPPLAWEPLSSTSVVLEIRTVQNNTAFKITAVPSVKRKSLETPGVHLPASIPLPLVVTLPQR